MLMTIETDCMLCVEVSLFLTDCHLLPKSFSLSSYCVTFCSRGKANFVGKDLVYSYFFSLLTVFSLFSNEGHVATWYRFTFAFCLSQHRLTLTRRDILSFWRTIETVIGLHYLGLRMVDAVFGARDVVHCEALSFLSCFRRCSISANIMKMKLTGKQNRLHMLQTV